VCWQAQTVPEEKVANCQLASKNGYLKGSHDIAAPKSTDVLLDSLHSLTGLFLKGFIHFFHCSKFRVTFQPFLVIRHDKRMKNEECERSI
jgi:hypothetical protein